MTADSCVIMRAGALLSTLKLSYDNEGQYVFRELDIGMKSIHRSVVVHCDSRFANIILPELNHLSIMDKDLIEVAGLQALPLPVLVDDDDEEEDAEEEDPQQHRIDNDEDEPSLAAATKVEPTIVPSSKRLRKAA